MKRCLLAFFLNAAFISYGQQDLNFSSEYNRVSWPVALGLSGGITGDDGNYKRLALYHGGSISLQVGSNSPGIANSKLFVSLNGVGIGTISPVSPLQIHDGPLRVSMGAVPGPSRQPLNWSYHFLGFNIAREAPGWATYSDGVNNGASMIFTDIGGNMRIAGVPSSGGYTSNNPPRYLSDEQINQNVRMFIRSDGNVGIGTTNPDAKLAVKGTIHAQEVKVDMNNWSDFVFNKDYKLRSLSDVQQYIDENHHLPDVPSEKEVLVNGQNLGEMNAILLKKIEELTLYQIELQNNLKTKDQQLAELFERVQNLEKNKP